MKQSARLLILISLAVAAPLAAGTRACTTALVTAGICRSTSDVLYSLSISAVAAPQVQAAIVGLYGYQSPAPCTPDFVAVGICTAGQLGSSVAVTKGQFVDATIRSWLLRSVVIRWNLQVAQDAATASALAAADPDIGN
jgi:hypothetical protein